MVDVSTALAIEEIVTEQLGQGRQVVIIGANSSVRNVFDRLDLPKRLGENSIFSTRQDALRAYSE
jgi:MFS superfamily sulfate permease-like transporter